ncbi:proliferating cell nuclear antigen family protein [Dictyostelium discoideum AX4]|uniref:Proliferating cell nuclear antigen family protein n=1 Tax=Dictyostelium discoideum TaxID=44689 RepID=Q86L07_DICDI|nr:proliferating cell nuclear antigen family protein [Dictyostelium discoideum AX4]EAL68935.1 proliferating cell nuclear antigen family protein [Dictyostelium discoideum AX4]|eukprot:XP_642963.1 proliferating cell nuclear antigen family protein [Dictyostelium discoideum AX4]
MGYDEDVMFIRVIKSNGTISNFKVPEVCVDIKEKYEISENDEYQCEVLMPSNLLSDICNELKSYKDLNLKIQVNKNNLLFKIDDSIINADIVLENKKTKEFYLICKKNFSIEFKNKYFLKINNIVKKINIKECFLQMNEKYPLIIIFSICSVSSFQFYLAPILE